MFTKDEILDESVDLSHIQEAEGYDDFDAVTRIIAENYENEMVVRDYMDKCDRKERKRSLPSRKLLLVVYSSTLKVLWNASGQKLKLSSPKCTRK